MNMSYCTPMPLPEDELATLKSQVASLTARVYQLERIIGEAPDARPDALLDSAAGEESQTGVPAPPGTMLQPPSMPSASGPLPNFPPAPPQGPPPLSRLSMPAVSRTISGNARAETDLEKKIGQYWLNRIGIVAMLIGVSYFLKFAFDNNWIGPGGRIAIGLLAGMGMVLWSEQFRSKGYAAFSYSLKAVGIGTLYLSLWGAYQIYDLIPAAAAFLAMAIVTAATIALALSQDAELLAGFALVGGFATPVLLSTGENHEAVLFCYVALLDMGILAMAVFKPWRRLLWGSFAGTIILYLGWYSKYYSDDQRALTVAFASLFAAIFAVIPLVTDTARSRRVSAPSLTLTLLPLFNAAAFFLVLFVMYEDEKTTLTWFALGLAAVYLVIGSQIKKRANAGDAAFLNLLHVAIAVAFLTIAIPLKLDAQWITIGWLAESGVLLWLSVTAKTDFLRYFAAVALGLGIARLLFYDQIRADTLVLNIRFATYAVAIAVLAGIAILGKSHAAHSERMLLDGAAVGANLLALIALTLEASDYFDRRMIEGGNLSVDYQQLNLERDFSYSAIWLVYGAILMTIGFRRRSAFVRWQSLILIAFTVCKVFLYDFSQLSFIYQRDWLGLSSHGPEKPEEQEKDQAPG
jgi:uncharacterized membrane protein